MAWDDEARKRGNFPLVAVQIEDDTGAVQERFANLEGIYGGNGYLGRLTRSGSLSRSIGAGGAATSNVSLGLSNADQAISIIEAGNLRKALSGWVARIALGFLDLSFASWREIFSGALITPGDNESGLVSLVAEDRHNTLFGRVQAVLWDDSGFGGSRASALDGKIVPTYWGRHSDSDGAIECSYGGLLSGLHRFVVSGHDPGMLLAARRIDKIHDVFFPLPGGGWVAVGPREYRARTGANPYGSFSTSENVGGNLFDVLYVDQATWERYGLTPSSAIRVNLDGERNDAGTDYVRLPGDIIRRLLSHYIGNIISPITVPTLVDYSGVDGYGGQVGLELAGELTVSGGETIALIGNMLASVEADQWWSDGGLHTAEVHLPTKADCQAATPYSARELFDDVTSIVRDSWRLRRPTQSGRHKLANGVDIELSSGDTSRIDHTANQADHGLHVERFSRAWLRDLGIAEQVARRIVSRRGFPRFVAGLRTMLEGLIPDLGEPCRLTHWDAPEAAGGGWNGRPCRVEGQTTSLDDFNVDLQAHDVAAESDLETGGPSLRAFAGARETRATSGIVQANNGSGSLLVTGGGSWGSPALGDILVIEVPNSTDRCNTKVTGIGGLPTNITVAKTTWSGTPVNIPAGAWRIERSYLTAADQTVTFAADAVSGQFSDTDPAKKWGQ